MEIREERAKYQNAMELADERLHEVRDFENSCGKMEHPDRFYRDFPS